MPDWRLPIRLSRAILVTVTGGVLSTMNPSEELSVDKPTSRVSMVGDKWFMTSDTQAVHLGLL